MRGALTNAFRPSPEPRWLREARDLLRECYKERMTLSEIAQAVGVNATHLAAALARLKQFRDDPANAYANTEAQVNALGYRLMNANRLHEAIEIFKLNVEAFPRAWNVYDSLGEAYMKKGNRELAIKNYEKSLELNPQNGGARDALHRLRAK